MFESCTNLEAGPEIYATNWGNFSMEYMFRYDAKLASVKMHNTGSYWNTFATGNWMNGVASSGTFYYNGTYTGRGTGAIPTGWTITTFTP